MAVGLDFAQWSRRQFAGLSRHLVAQARCISRGIACTTLRTHDEPRGVASQSWLRLRSQDEIQLTVCATNARTARRRVFTNHDLSVDALLASACLPQLFRAVEIDGEPYWDGALTGNPAVAPLLTKMPGCDLIIVRVDPVNRPEAPRSVRDIYNRSVEISHNATFWLELGALAVVLRFVDEGRSPFGRVRFHVMEASSVMERFPMSSKLNNYPPLLEYLFNLGRQTGDAWIAQNGDALGQRSTMDLQQLLPGSIWNNI